MVVNTPQLSPHASPPPHGGGKGRNGAALAAVHRPEDAHWNAERPAVTFVVEIGEYRGVVWVPRCALRVAFVGKERT